MDFKVNTMSYTTLDYDNEEVVQLFAEQGGVATQRKENEFVPTEMCGTFYGKRTELFYEKSPDGKYEVKYAPNGGRIISVDAGFYIAKTSSTLGGYILSKYNKDDVLAEIKIFDKNRNVSFRRQNTFNADGNLVKEEDFYGNSESPDWISEITYDDNAKISFIKNRDKETNPTKVSNILFSKGKAVCEIYNDKIEKFTSLSTYSYNPESQISLIIEKQIHLNKRENRQLLYKFDYDKFGNLEKLYINRNGERCTLHFAYNTKDELVQVKVFRRGKVASTTNICYKERNGEKFAVMNNFDYIWTVPLNKVAEQFTDPFPPVSQKGEYCRY